MRKLKILAICGFGVGTSLILRMNIERVLAEHQIDAEVTNADMMIGPSMDCDMIFTSRDLYEELKKRVDIPLIIIDNFLDLDEIASKGIAAIAERGVGS